MLTHLLTPPTHHKSHTNTPHTPLRPTHHRHVDIQTHATHRTHTTHHTHTTYTDIDPHTPHIDVYTHTHRGGIWQIVSKTIKTHISGDLAILLLEILSRGYGNLKKDPDKRTRFQGCMRCRGCPVTEPRYQVTAAAGEQRTHMALGCQEMHT